MGDLVLGYSPDSAVIGRELRAWVSPLPQLAPLSHTGTTRMVAMPGNHEVMSGKNQPSYANGAEAGVAARPWRPYLMPAATARTAGGPDRLATDQSQPLVLVRLQANATSWC